MNQPLLYVAMAGLGFGICPLLSRASRLGTVQIAVVVSMITGLSVLLALVGNISKTGWSIRGVIFCVLAGLANAFGFIAYSKMMSEPTWDLSRYMPITVAIMTLIGALGAILFFREDLATRKVAGFIFAGIAIWLLR